MDICKNPVFILCCAKAWWAGGAYDTADDCYPAFMEMELEDLEKHDSS